MARAMLFGSVLLASCAMLCGTAPAQVAAPAPPQDNIIVVQGQLDKLSGWREAETDHVVVISDGGEGELRRIAHNLERLDFLLSVLLGRGDLQGAPPKLRLTLVGDPTAFDTMNLQSLRFTPGPYRRGFNVTGYFDPREDGPVMAMTRFDSRLQIEHGTSLALILPDLVRATSSDPQDPEGPAAAARLASGPINPGNVAFAPQATPEGDVNGMSVPVTAESRIYAAFARNFLLTHFPNAYPKWYVDGFGELFSTMSVKADGQIEYGRAPEGYAKVLDAVSDISIRDVLSGKYLQAHAADSRWTPYHAWALAHMLFFSEVRRPQLMRYLAAFAAGQPSLQAAQAFGDLDALQREFVRYDSGKLAYERVTYPPEDAGEPVIRRLTEGEAAFVKGRLELGSRLGFALFPTTQGAASSTRAITAGEAWLSDLRRQAGRYPGNYQAQMLLAEAECRSGHAEACSAAAQRALGIRPESSDALSWSGTAMLMQALSRPAPERVAQLRLARSAIGRANRRDPENPLPLIAYYRSFADAGEAPPEIAVDGLGKVVDLVPAAPEPRLLLGDALIRRGDHIGARRALLPIANGDYAAPEQAAARALLDKAGG